MLPSLFYSSPANPRNIIFILHDVSLSYLAYPELFALVGARVPDFRGLFLRGQGGNAAPLGVQQGDAIRNFTGTLGNVVGGGSGGNGVFTVGVSGYDSYQGGHGSGMSIDFNVSRVVPTAEENRPVNKAVRYFIRATP